MLVQASNAVVLHDEFLRHVVEQWIEFNEQVAALAAAGTDGEVGVKHHSAATLRTVTRRGS
jgi:hypothetical protein